MSQTAKAVLTEKLAELLHRDLNREAIEVVKSADEIDHIVSLTEREVTTIQLDKQAALVKQVRRALQSIRDGEYGVCLECEEPIAEKRLAALPWATYCIHCQEIADTVNAGGARAEEDPEGD